MTPVCPDERPVRHCGSLSCFVTWFERTPAARCSAHRNSLTNRICYWKMTAMKIFRNTGTESLTALQMNSPQPPFHCFLHHILYLFPFSILFPWNWFVESVVFYFFFVCLHFCSYSLHLSLSVIICISSLTVQKVAMASWPPQQELFTDDS